MKVCDAYTPQATYNSFRDIYLVFEYMEGKDLRHFSAKKFKDYKYGAPIVADLTLQLFSAIAYLHQPNLKLIHRDIKPDNIFLRMIYEHEYLLKLGDLGSARQLPPAIDDGMTKNMCTWNYGAPEIISG